MLVSHSIALDKRQLNIFGPTLYMNQPTPLIHLVSLLDQLNLPNADDSSSPYQSRALSLCLHSQVGQLNEHGVSPGCLYTSGSQHAQGSISNTHFPQVSFSNSVSAHLPKFKGLNRAYGTVAHIGTAIICIEL